MLHLSDGAAQDGVRCQLRLNSAICRVVDQEEPLWAAAGSTCSLQQGGRIVDVCSEGLLHQDMQLRHRQKLRADLLEAGGSERSSWCTVEGGAEGGALAS